MIEVLGCAHEGREGTVIQRLGKGVIGVQPEKSGIPAVQPQNHAMIGGIAAVVGVVNQTGVEQRTIEKTLPVGQFSNRWRNIQVLGADLVMSGDELVPGADRGARSDRAVDRETGLLGIWDLAAPLHDAFTGS